MIAYVSVDLHVRAYVLLIIFQGRADRNWPSVNTVQAALIYLTAALHRQ